LDAGIRCASNIAAIGVSGVIVGIVSIVGATAPAVDTKGAIALTQTARCLAP
jgi:hypothetical protein